MLNRYALINRGLCPTKLLFIRGTSSGLIMTQKRQMSGGINATTALQQASANTEVISKIGDIKGLGLGNMTPPGLLEQGLEALHLTAGMPWWLSIVGATIAARVLMAPLNIKANRTTAVMRNIQPQVQQVMEEYKAAKMSGDLQRTQLAMQKVTGIYAEHKVHPLSPVLTSIVSAPVFISFFLALRDMSSLEFMKDGGILWFNDLTVQDPYWLLPVMAGTSFLVIVEKGLDLSAQQPQTTIMRNVFRIMGVGSIPLMATFPAALPLYWLTNNLCTMTLTLSLRVPAVKRLFKIPEVNIPQQQNIMNKTTRMVEPKKEMTFWDGFNMGREIGAEQKKRARQ